MFMHRLRTRRGERGVVAVEVAIVTPLLLMLVFGIVEFALLMRDDTALTSATRAGGRVASANADAGPGGINEDGDCVTPCSPANAPMFAQLAANAVQQAGSAMPKDSITEFWVYKANNKGYPGADGSTTMTCSTNCVKYKWVPAKDQFRYYSGTWLSSSVNGCAASPPDSVGVYIMANHKFLTGLFSASTTLDDHAVFAFEPLPTLTCAAGAHT
ncbi:hypothetical protein NOCA2110022 [metagenome]|uniref:TadE-like domain-containing protein n=1 Tax=metagenome TaxID=256318 RepID=A0A2P2BW50_9ZZZZ